ncbi:MAG: hypothetical protein M1825_006217 [Sarcosagium campestre]|nr:MAG: hypothetical protein M1825_006217 [Sarcosagium campestre]
MVLGLQRPSDLDKPEQLDKLLKAEEPKEDCWPCRITGSAALIGLGVYSFFSSRHQLNLQRAKIIKSGSRFGMQTRQTGVTGMAAVLVGMGVWRLVN